MFSVIFDMDGTLLDTQRICIPAYDYAGELQGIENLGRVVPDVCGTNEAGSTKYLTDNFPKLDIVKFRKDSRDYIKKNIVVKFKKGAEELLGFLKKNNIKIALASGTSRPSVMHHLNELKIADSFDAIVCGGDVINGKPAPDIFLLTADILKVNPEDCFVFEDSENGIRAGYAAGMKCIGIEDIAPFSDEVKRLMSRQLNSLDEAIEIFKSYLK